MQPTGMCLRRLIGGESAQPGFGTGSDGTGSTDSEMPRDAQKFRSALKGTSAEALVGEALVEILLSMW